MAPLYASASYLTLPCCLLPLPSYHPSRLSGLSLWVLHMPISYLFCNPASNSLLGLLSNLCWLSLFWILILPHMSHCNLSASPLDPLPASLPCHSCLLYACIAMYLIPMQLPPFLWSPHVHSSLLYSGSLRHAMDSASTSGMHSAQPHLLMPSALLTPPPLLLLVCLFTYYTPLPVPCAVGLPSFLLCSISEPPAILPLHHLLLSLFSACLLCLPTPSQPSSCLSLCLPALLFCAFWLQTYSTYPLSCLGFVLLAAFSTSCLILLNLCLWSVSHPDTDNTMEFLCLLLSIESLHLSSWVSSSSCLSILPPVPLLSFWILLFSISLSPLASPHSQLLCRPSSHHPLI